MDAFIFQPALFCTFCFQFPIFPHDQNSSCAMQIWSLMAARFACCWLQDLVKAQAQALTLSSKKTCRNLQTQNSGFCLSEACIATYKPILTFYIPTYKPTLSLLQTCYIRPPNLLGNKWSGVVCTSQPPWQKKEWVACTIKRSYTLIVTPFQMQTYWFWICKSKALVFLQV